MPNDCLFRLAREPRNRPLPGSDDGCTLAVVVLDGGGGGGVVVVVVVVVGAAVVVVVVVRVVCGTIVNTLVAGGLVCTKVLAGSSIMVVRSSWTMVFFTVSSFWVCW